MVTLGKIQKNYIEGEVYSVKSKLDGGKLNWKIRLLKVPQDKDVGELGGIKGLEEIRLL